MTSKQTTSCKMGMTLLAILSLTTITLSSCTKSPNSGNDGAKFAGTWTGTSSCGGSATFVLASSGNTVSTSGSVGIGSCVKSITFSGTASGNNVNFPSQTYTDGCGNSYTVSANGSISGTTLTLTQTASGTVSASCTFTGTK